MRYALNRLTRLIFVFFVVTFLVMVILRLGLKEPGRTLLGGTATDAQVAVVNAEYKLDQNYFVQYLWWLWRLIRFDLGMSVPFSTPISKLLTTFAPSTVLLGLYAFIFGLLIAVPVAVLSAYRRDGLFDRIASAISFGGVSVPQLVLAVISVVIFVTWLRWFPVVSERVYPLDDLGAHFRNYFLPTLTLTIPVASTFTRILRADMIQTLQSDFITLSRAKGMSPARTLWGHALRSSLFSIVTSIGLQLGGLLGGAVVVEQFFAITGLGRLLFEGILRKDFLVVQTCAALLVISVVFVNFVIDLLYAIIDPRIRHARKLA